MACDVSLQSKGELAECGPAQLHTQLPLTCAGNQYSCCRPASSVWIAKFTLAFTTCYQKTGLRWAWKRTVLVSLWFKQCCWGNTERLWKNGAHIQSLALWAFKSFYKNFIIFLSKSLFLWKRFCVFWEVVWASTESLCVCVCCIHSGMPGCVRAVPRPGLEGLSEISCKRITDHASLAYWFTAKNTYT